MKSCRFKSNPFKRLSYFLCCTLFCFLNVIIPLDFVSAQVNPPVVVSTSPANGAENVSVDLASVSFTFDRAMSHGYSFYSNFPRYSISWSDDQKTCTLLRQDLSTPLLAGMTYFITLNRGESTSFQDLSGIPLEEYSFSFTTAANYQLLKIPENTAKGFHWPYYLSIPNSLGHEIVLMVEPNNTGRTNDDWNVHDQAAFDLAKWRSSFAVELDAPLLVPTFPRPRDTSVDPPLWLIYTHALDRDSLITDVVVSGGSIERIDLQLIAMIRDAQDRLKSMGYNVDSQVFINGFSASGSFANRFTLLHPQIVKAAAIGSAGGWPTVPVSTWKGETLNYPVGIADLGALVGQPFDLQAFRRVPQYIYVGEIDDNDAVDYSDGFDDVDREIIYRLFGDGSPYIAERWPHAEEIFNSVGCSSQFVIYPGVAHSITQEMFKDILEFFESHKGQESPDLQKASSLFNLLEFLFPEILSPTPQPNLEDNGIIWRYYPDTQVAIGIIENDLYFLDNLGALHYLGTVDHWLLFAKAEAIFNWLESEFPAILIPSPQATLESDGIFYRYYSGTNVYIGIIENDLYFMNHQGELTNFGSADLWLNHIPGLD